MRRKIMAAGLLLVITGLGSGAAAQGPRSIPESMARPLCIIKAMKHYYEAQAAFQAGLHKLIVERAEHLAELSEANRDLQTALTERRRRLFHFLARTTPGRLTTDQGITQLANFDWTESDQAAWTGMDPEALELESRIRRLKAQVRDHADWPTLRAYVSSTLSHEPVFRDLTAALGTARKEAARFLERCA